MPQMSSLFWVLLMGFFILIYMLFTVTFYFSFNYSLNLSGLKTLNNPKFILIFDK